MELTPNVKVTQPIWFYHTAATDVAGGTWVLNKWVKEGCRHSSELLQLHYCLSIKEDNLNYVKLNLLQQRTLQGNLTVIISR